MGDNRREFSISKRRSEEKEKAKSEKAGGLEKDNAMEKEKI